SEHYQREHPAIGGSRDAEAADQRKGGVGDPGEDSGLRAHEYQQRWVEAPVAEDRGEAARQRDGAYGASRLGRRFTQVEGGGHEQRRGGGRQDPEHRLPVPTAGKLRPRERRGDRDDAEDDG